MLQMHFPPAPADVNKISRTHMTDQSDQGGICRICHALDLETRVRCENAGPTRISTSLQLQLGATYNQLRGPPGYRGPQPLDDFARDHITYTLQASGLRSNDLNLPKQKPVKQNKKRNEKQK
jgi:hypothetical protein